MSDIFREVDEDVRRDKAAEFWAKYQNYILGAAALLVLATAGYRFYDYRRLQTRRGGGRGVPAGADGRSRRQDRRGRRRRSPSSPRTRRAGYRVLARFADAALKAKSDPKAGASAYDALADDASLDPLMRDAARLRAALARLNAGDVDAAKSALEPLGGDRRRLSQHGAADARRAGARSARTTPAPANGSISSSPTPSAAGRARERRSVARRRRLERAGAQVTAGDP